MWSLPLPDNENAIEQLKDALTYKNGQKKYAITGSELEDIQKSYDKYEEVRGKACKPLMDSSSLSQQALDAIHDAYSEVQDSGRLSDLRSNLLLAAKRCPVCSIGVADELDHYLPRSEYKFLAVYSSNLVPMCHKCNNKKRAVAGQNPDDSFIHAYYDVIPDDETFLIAKTEIIEGKLLVEFEIEPTPNLSDDIRRMIVFQMTRVDFNSRVLREVNIYLGSFLVPMDMIYDRNCNAAAISDFLIKSADNASKQFGSNDWRASLLNSLAQNTEFCDGGYKVVLGE